MRVLPVLALSAALLGGACTDPYGRVDYGRTALLGAGIGAAALMVGAAASDQPRPYRQRDRYGPAYNGGYGYGAPAFAAPRYGRPYYGY